MYRVEFENPKRVTVYLYDSVRDYNEPYKVENVQGFRISTKKYLGSYKYTLFKDRGNVELYGERIVVE